MWETELVLIVRNIIGDTEVTYTYSDARLKTVICTCAKLVLGQLDDFEYTVSVENSTITPDPVTDLDYDFIALISLKTACFLMTSELRTKGLNSGFVIKDGPHSIDTKGMIQAIKDTRDDICKKYEDARYQYQLDASSLNGQAILTPYSPASWNGGR